MQPSLLRFSNLRRVIGVQLLLLGEVGSPTSRSFYYAPPLWDIARCWVYHGDRSLALLYKPWGRQVDLGLPRKVSERVPLLRRIRYVDHDGNEILRKSINKYHKWRMLRKEVFVCSWCFGYICRCTPGLKISSNCGHTLPIRNLTTMIICRAQKDVFSTPLNTER